MFPEPFAKLKAAGSLTTADTPMLGHMPVSRKDASVRFDIPDRDTHVFV